MDRTDAELLAGSARDPEAFGIFYDRHAESVLTYFARRTWDAQEAADLTAETFAAAFAGRRRYRDTGAPAFAWLLGIARQKLHRALRRQRIDDRARRRLHVERIAAGIDADIILAPTTAEYIGRWTCISAETRFLIDSMRGDPPQPPDTDSFLRVTPEVLYVQRAFTGGFTDRLVVVIGRAPEAGENPSAWPEVCGLRVVSEG